MLVGELDSEHVPIIATLSGYCRHARAVESGNNTAWCSNALREHDATDPAETLILVTADHGHVFTIAGYPKRGNPILGKVVPVGDTSFANASDGMPYTTLGYINGLGFRDLGSETDPDVADATDRVQRRRRGYYPALGRLTGVLWSRSRLRADQR